MFAGSSPLGVIVAKFHFAYGRTGKNTPFSMHLITNVSLDMHVERFFASVRFENKGKLEDLGLEIDKSTLNSID
jgi:hypothetical protein